MGSFCVAAQNADYTGATLAGDIENTVSPTSKASSPLSHFTWGAEAGSSLDMTSNDLSTFDIDVMMGYHNKSIMLAGVGGGWHKSVHSGTCFIPLYAVFRSSFTSRPSLLFMNVQAGYSFNSMQTAGSYGDFVGAVGVGVNLKQSKSSRSYVILSAHYQHLNSLHRLQTEIDKKYLLFARLVIGVNF